jgi:hypothetical protein
MIAKSRRCQASTVAIDGPVPQSERCVLKRGHEGQHECQHGFHFTKDLKIRPLSQCY